VIITYPTALYLSVIPQQASDNGNVTYTISDTAPPYGTLMEVKLPAAIENRQRSAINTTKPDGQRVYTNTLSNASSIGSAKKQFEVGQILEFETAAESTLQPMLVANSLEIQHNTNILDLSSLGVSDADITAINNSAETQFTKLNGELSVVRQARIDTETDITENQKNQNETKKAISALEQLVQQDNSLQSVLDSLRIKLSEFIVQMDALVVLANEQATTASNLENNIMAVAQMVR
jgi:hypothetical protein